MNKRIIVALFSVVCCLCLFASCTDGKKIQSVVDAIAALPDVEKVEIYDAEQITQASDMYNALSDAEKKKVSNYDKLAACESALESLERISECRNAISNLPSEATLLGSDRAALENARRLYDALSSSEQLKITNYQVLVKLEETLNSSGWVESSKIFYVDSENEENLSFLMRLKGGIASFTCNGEEIPKNKYTFADDTVTINKSVLASFGKETFNKFVISDPDGETFGFIVCKDIVKNQLVYFDFDTVSYTNGDPASVKNTVVDNGIDQKSLRFKQNTTTNNLFLGFYKEGNFGFPQFEFVEGRTYELSFLIKDNGLDPEYCLNMPISFKSGFDIGYIRNDADGLYIDLPKETGLDNLISTLTKVEGTSATYRFYSRFTITDENVCSDLQISCWKKDGTPEDVLGSIDVLMDDILLMAKSSSYTVKAYLENLPDDVTVKDKKYVYSVYDKYEALSDKEKADLPASGVSKLKKFRDYIFKEEVASVQAKVDELTAIPEADISALLYDKCIAVVKAYSALRDFEKAAVKNYEEISAIKEKISAARIADTIKAISDLSETLSTYEDAESLKELNLVAKTYYALEDEEKAVITNASKLLSLVNQCLPIWSVKSAITVCENTDAEIPFEIKYAEISSLTLYSETVGEENYEFKDGKITIKKEYLLALGKGAYPFVITDTTGDSHRVAVLYGFDDETDNYIDYDNRLKKREAGEIIDNGLSGASLRYKYDSAGDDTIIGFHYSNDYFGFAVCEIKEGHQYEITFDLKVLSEHTDEDKPYCFEVRYAYDSLLNINYVNGKYEASEKYIKVDHKLVVNTDGSISVKVIYTSANANDFVQFSTHNMPVDLLLDNVTIMCIS